MAVKPVEFDELAIAEFSLRGFPFIVVYREFVSAVQVIAVAHGRRRPG